MKGGGWLMSATCVPWDAPRGHTGVSKHVYPVSPHSWPWNKDLARVEDKEGGSWTVVFICVRVSMGTVDCLCPSPTGTTT